MNPFQPKILNAYKGQYGSQLQKSQNLTQGLQVKYLKGAYYKGAIDSVDKFIDEKTQGADKLKLFKSILRQRVLQGKQSVYQYNVNQISDYLPWVFSPKFLFQPFRSLLYCVRQNIPMTQAWNVAATLQDEMINDVAMKAIYQSLKYQAHYLQTAKNIFKQQYMGFFSRMYMLSETFVLNGYAYYEKVAKQALQGLSPQKAAQWMKTGKDKLMGLFKAVWNKATFIKDQYSPVYADDTQKGDVQIWKGLVYKIIQQMFKELRVYGDVIINFGYLKHSGQTKVTEGKTFFYFYDHPQILIGMQQSMPAVYRIKNSIIQKIPQSMFNTDLLRGIVMNDVIHLGGKLFKTLDDQFNQTKQEKQAKETFTTTFLNFNQLKNNSTTQNQKFRNYAKFINSQSKIKEPA